MKVSINDLLKIAEQETPLEPSSSLRNDVLQFINIFKIKEGKHKVINSIVFKAYKMWLGGRPGAMKFYNTFSKYIPPHGHPSGRNKHYMLNYRPIELLNK